MRIFKLFHSRQQGRLIRVESGDTDLAPLSDKLDKGFQRSLGTCQSAKGRQSYGHFSE